MAKVSMKIVGVPELIKNLEAAKERGKKAVGCGLYLEANNILAESQREVPVDISTLKNSRYITLPHFAGNIVTVEMGYGGSAKEYAEAQHEGFAVIKKGKNKGKTIYFRNHPGGGKSKFLQDPLYRAKPGFSKNVNHFAARAFQANQGAQQTYVPQAPR